jgi:hypothetical protein
LGFFVLAALASFVIGSSGCERARRRRRKGRASLGRGETMGMRS